MKLIGRKLYLDWGGNKSKYIVSIEKLPGGNADKMGLHHTVPESEATSPKCRMKTLLVDVISCMGERIERPVHGTRYPVPYGRELHHYLTDTSCWITKEENSAADIMHIENGDNIFSAGKFGDNRLFYVNPNSPNRDAVMEWIADNESGMISLHKNMLYISDDVLAAEFSLRFNIT